MESNSEITCVLEPSSLIGESIIRVSYTARMAGSYLATFAVNNRLIRGEFRRQYISGNSGFLSAYDHTSWCITCFTAQLSGFA